MDEPNNEEIEATLCKKDQVMQWNRGTLNNLPKFHVNALMPMYLQIGVLSINALIPYAKCHNRKSSIVDGQSMEEKDQL